MTDPAAAFPAAPARAAPARARVLPALAGLSAFVAIGIGAMAAHAVTDPQAKAWLATAAQFQLPHAVAVFAVLGWRDTRAVRAGAWALLAGSAMFAAGLDLLAFGLPRAVAALAPVGGTTMLLGWLWLAATAGWASVPGASR